MKAAVLHRPGDPLVIEDVELTEPGPGDVLVRVEAAGVCHSDLHYINGDLVAPLPAVLGHEGTGVVEQVGPGVTIVKPGDTVITTWRPRCGDCEQCSTGRPGLCALGKAQAVSGGLWDGRSRLRLRGEPIHHLMGVSCFAQRCIVSDRSVIPISGDVPPQIAAIMGCAVITGVGAALNQMRGATGEAAVVIGAGGVGLSAVMGLRVIGANPIIVVDTVETRLRRALELGATHVVNAATQEVRAEIAAIASPAPRWVLNAVGAPATLEQAVGIAGVGATIVVVGLTKAGATFQVPVNELVQQEKRIVGSLYGSSNMLFEIPRLLRLYRDGRLPLDALVGQQCRLDQINDAFAAMTDGAIGRAVVRPQLEDALG
ncbi:MAG TPA: Zn-dependent alcohol dehydrogenase [Actinomycetes bacterium]|nr:Zn-dependent alcohol dehydrogenase [Actinomycetes bacterium]